MPGKIKVKILAGRNLPVMDRSGDTTDAYVEIKFGNTTFKTDVCRKSLNPQWNSEWYRFEVDDAELQDEPLQVRLMDHDTYSANDAIGKVYVNLNPLLLPGLPPTVKNIWTLEATMNSSSGSQGGSVMTGWIPVFDTMHGIRGEVNIIVKVELFSDCNKFRQSSCGVQFFYSPNIPHGYHAQVIHGFVEELVVSDDPEYKWIDKIRTPRASNEARQTLFFKLSGEVQRKIGLKALDLGGNAVIGYVDTITIEYVQNFDLEGESGIVARGIGTAVTLVKLQDISSILPLENSNIEELTCFDLQSKNQIDFSESDDSLPLLSHSPNHSPISRSSTNLHATIVSPRFPKYDKTRKHHPRHAARVAEYRAAGLRARQLSLQHNTSSVNNSMRKGIGSSLSLADDLISESSLKNMLALEDMRGEPVGNPFSRGLKNFRYLHQNILPRRVAQIKSKISDSFDDESDPDSTYSSTWSLAGSESNRSSSIVDLRQSIRRKKFTHKKAANDGIAALLIRSVHSGFPLDSVREDRETPTPSPVNLLADLTGNNDEPIRRGKMKKDCESIKFNSGKSTDSMVDENFLENQILVGKNKHDVKYNAKELLIPMISSSETDTSTSDEDEPSESSTNYNILEDSYSLMDPSSADDTTYQSNFHRPISQVTKLFGIQSKIKRENIENVTVDIENEGIRSTALKRDSNLESSIDYNVLDYNNSLIEHTSKDEKKFEIDKFSVKPDNMAIDSEREGSIALEPNCSLESSTDYNILDDVDSLIEHSTNDERKFRQSSQTVTKLLKNHDSIEKFIVKSENIMIDTEKEVNRSISLEPNCSLESSTDYNILDGNNSLIEHSSILDEKFESSSEQATEVVRLLEISNKLEESLKKTKYIKTSAPQTEIHSPFSQMDESVEYRADNSIINKTYPQIDTISSYNEKSELGSQRVMQVTKFAEVSNTVPPVSSSDLRKNDNNLDNSQAKIIKQVKDESSITYRDCHSTSSTNYNFLDESLSPNENSSVDDGKLEDRPSLQGSIGDERLPEIPSTMIETESSVLEEIEEPLRKIEETRNVSAFESNIMSSLKNDNDLESSTDYNILDDVCSLTEPNSLDDYEKCEEYFQRDSLTSLPKFQEFSRVEEDMEISLKKADERNLSPISTADVPSIVPKLETNLPVYSAGKSTYSAPETSPSTTPTKLRHLKFLPKQKHFDITEDVGFVTSTPVETDVTLFADFEVSQKSPSRESFESSKFDFQPSTTSTAIEKSSRKITKFDTEEKLLSAEVSRAEAEEKSCFMEKHVQHTEKQVCPLGVSFDKITIVNENKTGRMLNKNTKIEITDTASSSASMKDNRKKESIDGETKITTVKKEKTGKKIERTDTVIYKGPVKERLVVTNRDEKSVKSQVNPTKPPNPIPIVVAPPPEDHATRLQVPVIQTTNINVQSTFSPDEMKTQHFGSIGSRKFPIDEWEISEKFNRKYRQHCILDLIRTIDAKMMVHHMHHERRDSTKSKRKRRERINASATPSPDSIHRTRTHKRRSKSRSPERQHVAHTKNQVSSLSTHSFPNSGISSIRNINGNFPQDSTSCNSSCENLSRNITNPPIVVCPKDTNGTSKEIVGFTANNNDQDTRNNHKVVVEMPVETISDQCLSSCLNSEVQSDVITKDGTNSKLNMLDPNVLKHPVYKSHSSGSLECLPQRIPLITKTTNTANTIDDLCVPCSPLTLRQQDEQQPASSPVQASSALPSSLGSKVTPNSSTAAKTNTAIPNMHRRSSDSDLSITPKGNSLAGSDRSMGGHMRPSAAIVRTMNQDTMEMLEYPFITMQQYPPGFVLNIGGLVSARSVKLLERITNLEEPEGRDAWWTEIRMEVRSHARALACNVVLGYKEEISICDDVCVLNASGTAAVINLLNANQDQDGMLLSRTLMTTSVESERDKTQVKSINVKSDKSDETSLSGQQATHSTGKVKRTSESNDHEIPYLPTLSACSLCHLPYSEASVPFRVDVSKCTICRRAKVPDVLFTTIELPENIPMTGRGVFLQATVCKSKRDLRGELNAKEISDCLPFLEYELHSLLLNKLKVKGMNAIFGLKVQVSVGERLVIGMAVGTAVYLTALPTPSVPQIASGNSWHNEEQLAEIQKTLIETVKKNREFYRLKPITDIENGRSITTSDTDESDDDLPELDLGIGTKDACVLEVDDVEDMDRINLLMDERPPDDFHVVNTQSIPGLEDLEIVRNLQMFTQVSRAKIPSGQFASMPSKYFARMLQTVLFKLRRMVPCALCDMQFKVALPEQDEIQLSVVGMALGLGEPTRFSKYKRKIIPNSTSKDPIKKTDDNDMIFSLDEDQADNTTCPQDSSPAPNNSNTNISNSSPLPGLSAQKHRPRSPFRTKSHMSHRHKHVPLKERYGVDITPLSYLPSGKIERYLGNLNFFFIRESTSIRENGGLSGFTHSFVTEILAIVRAHITALGGNAMVAFFMTQCVLLHSPHKNQGQCLINVGGDVVTVSYYGDDKYQGNQNC